jgi:hypothetical protein
VEVICKHSSVISLTETCIYTCIYVQESIIEKVFITNPLILEEQNSFKIIGTWAEQFSGMGNFAMTIWNSTCNPCFSTFDQIFFVFHGLKTGFFCYSLKINFICYPNRFFTYDYSLWDGGRQAKFNFDIKSSFVCSFCPSIFD